MLLTLSVQTTNYFRNLRGKPTRPSEIVLQYKAQKYEIWVHAGNIKCKYLVYIFSTYTYANVI